MQISENLRLRELNLQESYDSGKLGTELVADFFEPCLERANTYLRIAGYFNSGMLAACARGMAEFIRGSGQMKLICSPHLSSYDFERLADLENDFDKASTIFDDALVRSLDEVNELEDLLEKNHVEAMCWMIARNRLEIKIAIPRQVQNADQLFHQKRGIIEDWTGDRLSFSGSINETHAGWSRNVEEFKVFRSWVPGQGGFVESDRQAFFHYWEGAVTHSHTAISLSEALKKTLIQHAPEDISFIDLSRPKRATTESTEPKELRPLRNYQEAAVLAWNKAGKKGILQMATGAGKTLTAAHCIQEFLNANNGRGLVVVTAPYQHIASQWISELSHYKTLAPWKEKNWRSSLASLIRELRAGLVQHGIVVTVQNTAATQDFVSQIELASETIPTLFVGDEAHSLGARTMSRSLSEAYTNRLGLTATPTRYFDEDGSNNLKIFFGGTVYVFSLEDALSTMDEMGRTVLCPYEYRPVFFNLLPEELDEYKRLSREILWLSSSKDPEAREKLQRKLLRRSRLIKNSEGKLPGFRSVIRDLEQRRRLVVYCENLSQMDAAASILSEFGVKYSRFSGAESVNPDPMFGGLSEREVILQSFTKGEIDALVAMKCLDEGVNIPTAEVAVLLASSGNPKEFIQRRGRMMRQSPATGKAKAVIIDMVAVPELAESGLEPTADDVRIMNKELSRVSEFSRSAINASTVEYRLYELRLELGIPGASTRGKDVDE